MSHQLLLTICLVDVEGMELQAPAALLTTCRRTARLLPGEFLLLIIRLVIKTFLSFYLERILVCPKKVPYH